MNVIASVGIIVLAMLILASLQLSPGVFALFYHYTLGNFSKIKASNFTIFFIIGVEFLNTCVLLSLYFLTCIIFIDEPHLHNNIFIWILIGFLICLGFASLFFYFRRGRNTGTKLFIPRRYAKALDTSAKTIHTKFDAFLLGISSSAFELIFTLPLYMASSLAILLLDISHTFNYFIIFLYILAPTIPLFSLYWQYRTSHNLADIERSRIKNKTFIRCTLSISFFLISVLLIYLGVTT